jgi:hypothetical protein
LSKICDIDISPVLVAPYTSTLYWGAPSPDLARNTIRETHLGCGLYYIMVGLE